jgi:FkbM family methyltransferase
MLADLVTAAGDRLGRQGAAVALLRPVYSRWLRAVYRQRGLPWHVNGEALRIDPDVRHLTPHENELPLFRHLKDQIAPGSVVFDVGSFLGVYAMMAARWSGAHGRVLAFEPSRESFRTLQRHLAMNALGAPRVDARCAAVGALPGRRELMTFDAEPYRNMLAPQTSIAAPTLVDVLTIDGIASTLGQPPDWIRMDVQGLEFEVLAGAAEVLRERRGRLRIVAEMHPEQWPDYGVDPRDAHDRFAALGLQASSLVPGEPVFAQGAHAILQPLT